MTNTTNLSNSEILTTNPLSPEQINRYHQDGFIIIPSFFARQEIEPLYKSCVEDTKLQENETTFLDSDGKICRFSYFMETQNTLLGSIPRLARMVDAVETLLGGKECYHWHSKVVRKEPHSQGYFNWHQGYGSWYYDGCLFPDFVSTFVAVTSATKENGCVQVLKSSHLLGRIDHVNSRGNVITDPERMEVILKKLELVYCEMQPGDVLIMHGNTLHYSENNQTDHPRILVVSHYNSADNEPYDLEGAEMLRYRPLNKLPDSWLQDKKYDSVLIDKDFFNQQKTDDAELYAGVGNLEKRYSRIPNTREIN